jgi:hypothetical protein
MEKLYSLGFWHHTVLYITTYILRVEVIESKLKLNGWGENWSDYTGRVQGMWPIRTMGRGKETGQSRTKELWTWNSEKPGCRMILSSATRMGNVNKIFFSHGAMVPSGSGPPHYQASWSHSDTTHLVGLLWKSDQPDTENSTSQHTVFKRHPRPRRDLNPQSQQVSSRRPTP